jgi:predicted RNase H-like nuclease/protein-L-isoaspartate O-methyltransferase
MNQHKAAYFDKMAAAPWAAQPFQAKDKPKIDRLLAAAEIHPGMRVLEPGCGTGRLTAILAEAVGPSGHVLALDISGDMVQACRDRLGARPTVQVVQAAIEDYALEPAGFDLVVCHQVLPHFDDPVAVCARLARALKPGGRLLVVHFTNVATINEIHRKASPPIQQDRLPLPVEMRGLLADAGLAVDRCVDDELGYCVRGIRPRAVAGIDGCRGGWLCLVLELGSGRLEPRILPQIAKVLDLQPRPMLVAVDVPIGLPDAGLRECDREARRRLSAPRSSSVFPTPVRPILEASSYLTACELGQRVDGRKLSRQTWGILPKIREVDAFLRADPARQTWVREVHPEVSFWAWNAKTPMAHQKKSADGRAEREALIRSKFGDALAVAQSKLPRGQYAADDLLDAFAALWTAERIRAGEATTIPSVPPLDAKGLRMEIVV